MRVYRQETGRLVRRDEPVPEPQRGEVLVRVEAASLNYRDLLILGGDHFTNGPGGLIPVSDAAGEVAAVGEGVTRFAVGDRVLTSFHSAWFGGRLPAAETLRGYGNAQDGWLAEYRAVSEQAVVALPDSLTYEQGATLPCAAVTAWTSLSGLGPAETVLTLGTGGVSLFALQLAKAHGARVVATTSSPAKAAKLTELGADVVIDYRATPEWGKAVLDATGGRGVDRIVEVGGPGTFAQSLVAAGTNHADIAVVGFVGTEGPPIDYMDLFRSGATVRKIWVGSRQDTEDLVRWLTVRPIEPVVDSVHPFDRAVEAFRHFGSRENLGKVVITTA
ncbi:NAD(P)-dependent alcohol dehydrogenase [Amycolatopsis sp. OK19-0408]|uniref:NAD(P)-dependent alcohol dehydrogenase n=1 Tax=Amycolatopsis iheyensis TaxID=2945988 RepID=A0A9X2NHC8_9PSEU|nr:NAD(P)-dependent alcohol dehydrogenase [Amycolatopsis iheyensis]MCR6486724.1 NAD(P)-dependent alcohol dehydrogenase [Amycolatopsis iheyensis]